MLNQTTSPLDHPEILKGWLIEWTPADEESTTTSCCGFNFIKRYQNGGKYTEYSYPGHTKKLKELLYSCPKQDPHDFLTDVPAEVRIAVLNLRDYKESQQGAMAVTWDLAATMPVFRQQKARKNRPWASASRDAHHDHAWLVILKRNPIARRVGPPPPPPPSQNQLPFVGNGQPFAQNAGRLQYNAAPRQRCPVYVGRKSTTYSSSFSTSPYSSSEARSTTDDEDSPRRVQRRVHVRQQQVTGPSSLEETMPQEEAEKMMEAFLATFTAKEDNDGVSRKDNDGGE